MISNKIMVKTCTVKEVTGHVFDVVGCQTGDLYGAVTSGIPCYYSQFKYETLDGKEPIKDTFRMYINDGIVPYIDTSYKVFVDGKEFDILDWEDAFSTSHVELILKQIGI